MRQRIIKLLFPRYYKKRYITFDKIELPIIIDSALDNEWYVIEVAKLTRIPEEYWK